MTTAVNDRRIQYTATASQTIFPYDFPIDVNSELEVKQTVNATGLTNTLVLTTDYTVSGVGDAGGGDITLLTGAAVNDSITITGKTPASRTTDFNQAGDFLASELNAQFDKITRVIQENETQTNRSVLLDDADTTSSLTLPIASERANKFLGFDSNGDAIAASDVGDAVVSAFMTTVLDDETAAAARTTLDAEQKANSLTSIASLEDNDQFIVADNSDSDNSKKIIFNNLAKSIMPIGMVFPFAANSEPSGFLECDGSAISRTTYSALFAIIGTTWGAGDGSTTFNIPDLRGEFIRGWDNGKGTDSGRSFASSQDDALQGHHHNLRFRGGSNSSTNLTASNYIARSANIYAVGHPTGDTNNTVSITDSITDGSNGAPRTASETRPRNHALMYCIKF